MSREQPRILITRLSHIGDCILTVPVLTALRHHFPGAYLAWVVERPSASLLEGHAALDELIVVPRKWLKSPNTVWQLRKNLRRGRFDVSIDPQSLTKSAIIGRLAAARRRIGFAGEDGRELSKVLNNIRVQRTLDHMVDRSLELLKPLGIESPHVRFDLPIDSSAEQTAGEFLGQADIANGIAVINPGAGWPSKLWPPVSYAAVARYLGQQHGLRSIVVWAGDEERRWAEQIVAGAAGQAILAPPTSLQQLASITRRAKLFVGSDTGPLHLAAAVGTTCVSVYGPTLPSVCGPYGSQHVAIQEYYQAAAGNRERRRAENKAMKAVHPDRVCLGCDQVLENQTVAEHTGTTSRSRLALRPFNHGASKMIDIRKVTDMHRETVVRWHQQDVDNPYEGILATACDQHSFNFLLWHEEDIARSPDVGDARIAAAKRAIDYYNQQRNDWIEKLDDQLAEWIEQSQIEVAKDATLNTETPGSVIDRLSILSLRIYHLQEQLERDDVTPGHVASVEKKLAICLIQHDDLSLALETLMESIGAGRTRHRTYRQLKMYNDPTLNPYLYRARKMAG